MDEKTWRLGWRMVENAWNKNHRLAELQFDSLLSSDQQISEKFIIQGIKTKLHLSKDIEAKEIFNQQPEKVQRSICEQDFAKKIEVCSSFPKEQVDNRILQLEIIKMFLNDQAVRGNLMEDILLKYNVDSTEILREGEIIVAEKYQDRIKEIFWDWGYLNEEMEIIENYINDPKSIGKSIKAFMSQYDFPEDKTKGASMVFTDEINRTRLKEIIAEFGFPTEKLIGKDAMRGIFFMIQHSDGDREWQKAQLPHIESGVQSGEFSKQDYAFLYDRIQKNQSLPQRYGSQFGSGAKMKETEDLPNLDNRRREMDMMPIDMYTARMQRLETRKN